jgi:hypothetical protein
MGDQRIFAKSNDPRFFSAAKRQLLDELEFDWRSAVGQKIDTGSSRPPKVLVQCEKSIKIDPTRWMARYRELKKFKAENGHLQAAPRTTLANL